VNKCSLLLAIVLLLTGGGTALAVWVPIDAVAETPPTTQIVMNNDGMTVVDVVVHGFYRDTSEIGDTIYDNVTIPGDATADLDIGRPQIPKVSHLIGIPDNSPVGLSVQVLETRQFGNYLLYPFQGPQLEDSEYAFVLDTAFYQTSTPYPFSDGSVVSAGAWRTLSVANIRTYPVKYVPATRQLLVSNHYQVMINHAGGSYVHKVIQPWIGALYAHYVDNFAQLNIEVNETDNPGVEYLVVCYQDYQNSVNLHDLLQWDSTRGIRSRLLVCDGQGAAWVKDRIMEEYYSNDPPSLRWVLLIGTRDQIPMFQMGQANVWGDYWYSDWWSRNVNTPDQWPDVGVARLSPISTGDLEGQLARIKNYQKSPDVGNDWLSRMLLIANKEGYPHKYSACIRGIYDKQYSFHRYNMDTIMGHFAGQNNAAVKNSIELGRGIVVYRGHGLGSGGRSYWYNWTHDSPRSWDYGWVQSTDFHGRAPVVYNVCCLCGGDDENALTKAWMEYGASASLAATGGGWTKVNHGICSTLVRCTGDNWEVAPPPPSPRTYEFPTFDIGWIKCNADAYVSKYWTNAQHPEYLDNMYMYYFLGDPAMQVWSGGVPQTASVTYEQPVPIGPYNMPVQAEVAGRPVENALVCLWKKNSAGQTEFYSTGTTGSDGRVRLTIAAATPGEFSVVVSNGHAADAPHTPILPWTGTCTVAGGNANIVYQSSTIDDAPPFGSGNGNGCIEPGEAIHLPTTVINTGNVMATQVRAELQQPLPDIEVTIVQPSSRPLSPSDIPPIQTAVTVPNLLPPPPPLSPPGFVFTVSQDCPIGHQIHFRLHCTDSQGRSWDSPIDLTVTSGLPTGVDQTATFPTQARHLVRRPNSEELHIVYQKKPSPLDPNHVCYQRSFDGGTTWMLPEDLGVGQTPCVTLDYGGSPWVCYIRDNHLFCQVKRATGEWCPERLVFYNTAGNENLGPASMVCSNMPPPGTEDPDVDMAYATFVEWRYVQDGYFDSDVEFVAFDTSEAAIHGGQYRYYLSTIASWTSPATIETMPCIARTPGDFLHAVWQQGRAEIPGLDPVIQYSTALTAPSAIRAGAPVVWQTADPLASGNTLNSPFVDAFGQEVYVAWADAVPKPEGNGRADVWRREKQVGPGHEWLPRLNWSQTPGYPSDYPSLSAGVLAWANDGTNDNELRARWNLTELPVTAYSGGQQTFAHADYQSWPSHGMLRMLFTEQLPGGRYAVRLATYIRIGLDGGGGAFYAADIGDPTPSTFCVQRDGAKQYSSCDIDYDSTQLEYQLLYLNPLYHYRARLIMYHEDPTRCRTCTEVDSGIPQTLAVWPREQETLWVEIPQESYRNTKTNLSISKLAGREAVLADLTVFQYEDTNPSDGGGAQTGNTEGPRLLPAISSASLFSGNVRLNYVVPSAARVSLRVFDHSGRVVRVLQDGGTGIIPSGRHTVDWDGHDDLGKALPGGVYFCRLEAQDFCINRKLVLTR
jgi:hypothetical protein